MIEYLFLGCFVGICAGMFGIGGGGIMVPVFTMIFLENSVNEPLHLALGSSMCAIIITSFSSFKAHNKNHAVRWDIFKFMAPGVVVGTMSSAFVASIIPAFYLALIFSLYMFIQALRMFFTTVTTKASRVYKRGVQFIAGAIIGAVSAIVSIGGGSLSVPYVASQGVDIKKAIGTSAAIGFPLSIAGTFGYIISGWQNTDIANFIVGYVNLKAVFFTTITSFLFAPLGVKIVHHIKSSIVRKIFGVFLFALSINMFLKFI